MQAIGIYIRRRGNQSIYVSKNVAESVENVALNFIKAPHLCMLTIDCNCNTGLPYFRFGSVSSTFIMDDVRCTGTESDISQCPHNPNDNCGSGEGAGVKCGGKKFSTCSHKQYEQVYTVSNILNVCGSISTVCTIYCSSLSMECMGT